MGAVLSLHTTTLPQKPYLSVSILAKVLTYLSLKRYVHWINFLTSLHLPTKLGGYRLTAHTPLLIEKRFYTPDEPLYQFERKYNLYPEGRISVQDYTRTYTQMETIMIHWYLHLGRDPYRLAPEPGERTYFDMMVNRNEKVLFVVQESSEHFSFLATKEGLGDAITVALEKWRS